MVGDLESAPKNRGRHCLPTGEGYASPVIEKLHGIIDKMRALVLCYGEVIAFGEPFDQGVTTRLLLLGKSS